MTTWEDLKAHLRLSYVLEVEEAALVELTWEFDDERDRWLQPERLEPVSGSGRPRVIVTAPVGAALALDPRRALEHNATLAVGALAIEGDVLMLRAVLSLEDASLAQVEEAMLLLAHEAARQRRAARRS